MLTIRLPADIENRLETLSKTTGRTKTFYAREAILVHLEALEDHYEAKQRLADLRAVRPHGMTLEEALSHYWVED
ncbi:type II toxin-antitoxin system RelB family antitoxin [Chitinimonas sp. PSY-7]|uniref:type II toxin-antitoxin system RelB family antitoxin n=1 Tax=Chitinimonas sp. PSY-7 TaxID=3459088 RepID=UPI00403FEF4D